MPHAKSRIATLRLTLVLLLLTAVHAAADAVREKQHERLGFLVGAWNTSYTLPSTDGEATVVEGEAVIEWTVGNAWLRHELEADFPGRGPVFMTGMMNYSPTKEMYNFYMFDHFGGEAGAFYGDWTRDEEIVLTARFTEEDGSTSHQRLTLKPVSADEVWIRQAFSDDGEHYHFQARFVYTRQPE